MKKTKLTRSLMAAVSIVALTAVLGGCLHDGGEDEMDTGGDDMMDMPTTPTSGSLTLPEGHMLGEGTETIPAGMSRRIGNTEVSCPAGGPDCILTVAAGALTGTVTATWEGAEPTIEVPADTFAELNDGSTASIRALVTTEPPTATSLRPTELTGMGLGGMGVKNTSGAALRSSFDPNQADAGGTAGAPGAVNGLTGGSMLGDKAADAISGGDIASAHAGWGMKTLFRDWGDTAGTGDGGFETGAIVVKNHEGPTSHPWDAMLAGRFVNNFTLPGITLAGTTNNPYHFTVRKDGVTVDTNNPADTVEFTVDTTSDTPGGMGSHVNANVTGAGSLAITVTSAEDGAFRRCSVSSSVWPARTRAAPRIARSRGRAVRTTSPSAQAPGSSRPPRARWCRSRIRTGWCTARGSPRRTTMPAPIGSAGSTRLRCV